MLGIARRCPIRAIVFGWDRPILSFLLIALLAGGICPAFYGAYLPHDHVVTDGPSSPAGEYREHPNPLLVYLGVPVLASAQPDHDGERISHIAVSLPSGRGISVSTGVAMTVLAVMTSSGLPPTTGTLVRPGLIDTVHPAALIPPQLISTEPPMHPPRFA